MPNAHVILERVGAKSLDEIIAETQQGKWDRYDAFFEEWADEILSEMDEAERIIVRFEASEGA